MPYPTQCHDLALLFLAQEVPPGPVRDLSAHKLAEKIWTLVEDFITYGEVDELHEEYLKQLEKLEHEEKAT